MFELLPVEHTGVDFTITWDKPAKYDRVFYSQNTGGGVCIGDFDGDGKPDIYLTSPSGGNHLFRNLGDFRFQDVTQRAGLLDVDHWGMGATFVDIDNDADLDIYVCGYDCRNKLYVNRGDGTFEESASKYGLDFHGASVMMAFADYDRDGDLDGYLLTAGIPPGPGQEFKVRFEGNRPVIPDRLKEFWQLLYLPGERAKQVEAGQYDHLYRNNGDGTFTEVTHEAGIDGPEFGQAAQWWDCDGDGWPDLYVANDYWGADHLYHNNGDGTFTDLAKSALPHTPWSSMGADVVDLNNDGLFDLMATDMSSTTHYKQKVGMGDMSGGWFLEYPEPRQYMRNSVYLNTGTPRFMEVAYLTGLANTDWTWTTRFDDFDNDGWADVFITNGMTRDFTNSDLNERAKAVAREGSPEFFRFWRQQALKRDRNLAFKNLGDLRFENVGDKWGLDRLGVSFGAATGDLDGDGDLDLVVNNMDTTASIYRNGCASGGRLMVRLRGTTSNRLGIGSVVRIQSNRGQQVRYLTHARGWTSCAEPVAHFGLGDDVRVDKLTVEWPSGHRQEFEDLAVNRLYTITEPDGIPPDPVKPSRGPTLFVSSNVLPDAAHREQPFDDFRGQPLLPNKLSQLGPGMAWGDVDGDGDDDVYFSGAKGQRGRLFLRQGTDRFEKSDQTAFQSSDCEQMAPLLFDADGDGDLDLYVVSGGVECQPQDSSLADRLFFNDGHGQFSIAPPGTLPPLHDSGSTVVAADFDRDGDLDLFVGSRCVPGQYPVTPQSRMLRNEGGRFEDVTDELAPGLRLTGLVTAALWSDVDGDGWIDLLVAHEWGPVKLYRNQQGKLIDDTQRAGLGELLGWWNGIAGGDLDRDGDIDYVVTNFGLNTKYHPTPEKPVRIYYGDFDGSGRNNIVEAKVTEEGILPVRGKSCSQNAIPMLRAKFPTYHSFALASLSDIYTQQCLERCLKLEVNTLESGVMINDGEGRFVFKPLPRLAQVSPGFGVAVTEVDGDGNPDVYIAQNYYGPQRETGRMDGGVSLLLRGNGDGTFTEVWPRESGLLVPGDAKSLTITDLNDDGHPDFVVAVNDGPVMTFEQQPQGGHQTMAVKLIGRGGNPIAAGARVTLQFRGGPRDTAEIYAGGGYLSQSSHVVYFGVPEGQVPEQIEVRWPDGATTTHTANSSSPIIEIVQQ